MVDINSLKETHKWGQDVWSERSDDIIIVLVGNIDLNNKRYIYQLLAHLGLRLYGEGLLCCIDMGGVTSFRNRKVMGSRLLWFLSWGGIITPQKDLFLSAFSYHLPCYLVLYIISHLSRQVSADYREEKSRDLSGMFETSAKTNHNMKYVTPISLYNTSVALISSYSYPQCQLTLLDNLGLSYLGVGIRFIFPSCSSKAQDCL